MIDKVHIIIDGIDVSECDRLIVNQLYGYICNCEEDIHLISCCKNRPNCHFKQLARKTQECEELKELLKLRTNDRVNKLERAIIRRNIKIDRYRKALEEIEKELKEDVYCESQECGCDDFEECLNCVKTQILNIINKAKGGE